ncbi:MAG TPA: DUF87 domain-containing protein [Phycisphaerae bacterium]|nr:DUF87 domain-containing protein [Phycisphaerae bacterium]HNU44760.1 DUF87 domain-containing protein [Phycisphaerae bacterium]
MLTRVQELCRKLKPVLGQRIDGLWLAYLADSDPGGRGDIEQTLELLAAKHLGQDYQPDRAPFPPPSASFAARGDVPIGAVAYASRALYPFRLQSDRLKEHLLIAGRSGSGKTNLTFVLLEGLLARGIHVLALDWKRGYRDLLGIHPELCVYTIGRDIAPFRFNPLIPPPGCEPHVWIKLITDAMARAYLGGEGVISLFVAGLDKLYADGGVFTGRPTRWPTVRDLLEWLRATKLKGRAALWQASADRILLAMTYGEFGDVVDTQDNHHVQELLDHHVVLEMDGLSSSSDRVLFSEALTLYLYRTRLVEGPRSQLTNVVVLEEAHNLLHARTADAAESALESSIRMIRQYGIGYVFVDQSASLLSRVAFANCYAQLALSQKLRADVQTMAGAMNLSDEQKESLNTLPIGSVVVRLADEHPEPFLVRVPRSRVREGSVSDADIRQRMAGDSSDTSPPAFPAYVYPAIPPIPPADRTTPIHESPHPPSPRETPATADSAAGQDAQEPPPLESLGRETIRFLADVAARPLSTTVSRYQRLHFSRRRGNAIRTDLLTAGLIEAVSIATRSGQVVLYQLTDAGRSTCARLGIDPGPLLRASLEHSYWADRLSAHYEAQGLRVTLEHAIPDDGFVDLVAENDAERVAIEVETGKSDVAENVRKLRGAGFDRIVLFATSPAAVEVCRRVLGDHASADDHPIQLLTWLDL